MNGNEEVLSRMRPIERADTDDNHDLENTH